MRAKYKPGKFVDLNTADTIELMRIPGIGPVRAKHIVEYRRALGGFHSIAQVHEAYDLPEHLGDWVHIGNPRVKELPINKVSLSQLRTHPYLTFYQARAIIELRKREGNIRSVRQLLFLDEFTEEDIARLTPYLSFE
jgi:DNA uptake protein ComE-like DNA-binding protein